MRALVFIALCLFTVADARRLRRRGVYAGVATFTGGQGGPSGTVRFDGACARGFMQVTVSLVGLGRRYGAWTLNDGVAWDGCDGVLGESFGYHKGKPLVPYGQLSARLGVLTHDDTIERRVFLDDVLGFNRYSAVGKVLVLRDAATGAPRVCVPVLGEFHPRPWPRG